MSLLTKLNDDSVWNDFLEHKISKKHLSEKECLQWTDFIENRRYCSFTEHLAEEDFHFDYPRKIAVNKSNTGKKRIVYSYGETESMILKLMAFLLYRYDSFISDSCYSFRQNRSAKDAISQILAIPNLSEKFCCKVDISNYFNSIPTDKLLDVLNDIITDDQPLLTFLTKLLQDGGSYENNNLIFEERGAMAGTPTSPFFANIYLLSLDRIFEEIEIPYFRYSDDIIFFTDSETELHKSLQLLINHITGKGLSLNPDKLTIKKPGEPWEFLGFCYKDGEIDLSEITKNKLKAKIRRKAHSLYRWRIKKDADFERTAKAMIRTFNKKFYDDSDENRFTWSRWFFPVLTTSDGLKELDAYLIQYIRYLATGRHYKGNYRITYDTIKELGFRSLVHEYYAFCKNTKNSFLGNGLEK